MQEGFLQTFNSLFEKELLSLIEKQIESKKEIISRGHGIYDYCQFRHHLGVIEGLRMIADLCEEANEIISKR